MAPQREWFEKDYYTVLGLQKGATEKEITRAYRKLAKQYHPDANPGNKEAEDKFKDISSAYDVLSDAGKRPCRDSTGQRRIRTGRRRSFGLESRHTAGLHPQCVPGPAA